MDIKYTGKRSAFDEWIFSTFGMGILPLLIRCFVFGLCGQSFSFEVFHVELFFITIVFCVDALKNFGLSQKKGIFTFFVLLISVVIYTLAFLNSLDFVILPLSPLSAKCSTYIFIGASFLLDIASLDG